MKTLSLAAAGAAALLFALAGTPGTAAALSPQGKITTKPEVPPAVQHLECRTKPNGPKAWMSHTSAYIRNNTRLPITKGTRIYVTYYRNQPSGAGLSTSYLLNADLPGGGEMVDYLKMYSESCRAHVRLGTNQRQHRP